MYTNIWVYIGVIGSGKDYNAKKKQEETGGVLESFSEGVREFTFDFLGWKPSTSEMYEKFKYNIFKINYPNYTKCHDGRKFLENVGFKMRQYDQNFWAKYCQKKCIEHIKNGVKDIIIYDCRYLNEAKVIFELIDKYQVIPYFYFVDYKSNRYELRKDDSEYFAQYFVEQKCKDGENITEKVRKLLYDEHSY